MTDTTSKLGADMLNVPRDLLQDLTDDVADYAVSRTFKDRETTWRSDLLDRARALLARQPAAIDKEAVSDEQEQTLRELLACFRAWEPQVRVLGNVRADAAANAINAAICARLITRLAAPLDKEASKPAAPSVAAESKGHEAFEKATAVTDPVMADFLSAVAASRANPAPSVAQDERGASWAPERIWLQRGIGEQGSHTWCEDSIDDCEQAEYMRISRESCPTCHGNDSDLPCAFPEGGKPGCPRDIRLARAASTSANVAQGAEAVTEDISLVRELQKALFYWMPRIAGEDSPAGHKAAEHSYLLIGLDDNSTECYGDQARSSLGIVNRELERIGIACSDAGCPDEMEVADFIADLYARAQAAATVASTDDARECLADVVSHYRALYAGLAFQLNEATVSENSDDMTYWKHEIKALERMYAQAERALTAAQSASGDTK
jgi:hypothetical protein